MADLPDYYTQAQISEAEAASFKGGLATNRPDDPVSRDIYLGTDTLTLYFCVVDGDWEEIGVGYLLLAGGTMTGNIAMGGNKVTGLGAPTAQNNALRYGQAEIRNAEIAVGAAIAYAKLNLALGIKNADVSATAAIIYSKLNLALSILTSDIKAAEFNVANKLVKLDASADVPDAQIPSLNASKITAGRFPVNRLPAMTDEMIWKGTGVSVEEVAMPAAAGGARLNVTEFRANAATGTFTTNPEYINDNNTTNSADARAVDQYAEVLFNAVFWVSQYRQYGDTDNVGGGEWKLQVLNPATDAWGDWITGIGTRTSSDWSDWVSDSKVLAAGIRLVCTVVDLGGTPDRSTIRELEVKY